MGVVLKNSPSATEVAGDDTDSRLSEGEQYASPVEHQFLDKVMSLVHHSFEGQKKEQKLIYLLHKAKNVGMAIGFLTFQMLMNIYLGAKHSGTAIPPTVFFAQGGAVYQTIEMLLQLAESAGVHGIDPDHVRETAMGVVMDNFKKNYKLLSGGLQKAGNPQQMQAPPAAAANPLSHAVGQGLQQQGLLGG